MNLRGVTAVLTGAAHGLGRELALLLDTEGCRLLLVDRDAAGLESLRGKLSFPAQTYPCDLGDAAQRRALIARIVALDKRLDLLVNSAGVGSHSSLEQLTVDEVEHVLQVNTLAPLALIAGLRSQLAAGGCIVNIGSVVGELHLLLVGLYAASKAALHSFSRCVALEGVNCLLVILGPMRGTDFTRSIAHPRTVQPSWYRRLDVDVVTAARLIVQAVKRGRLQLAIPGWYSVVFVLSRLFAPVVNTVARFYSRKAARNL
jgi:short-subunit dehydrogenase